MFRILAIAGVLALAAASPYALAESANGSQGAVTAIDIALEPDAAMTQHAAALNARLRQAYPKGYALDATHRPHVTLLQRYVKTADLPDVYRAVGTVLKSQHIATWKLQAFRIDHAVWSGLAVTVILVKPTNEVLALQQRLIGAIAPYTVKTGTAAAFATTAAEPDINASTIGYVAAFVPDSTGKKYVPHVTAGVAPVPFVEKLESEPFAAFAFSPVAVSVYQLGNFGTARKELESWTVAP